MPRCYAVSSHVGAVAVMLVVAHAVGCVSATGGGLACTLNVQCGQPAANMQQVRGVRRLVQVWVEGCRASLSLWLLRCCVVPSAARGRRQYHGLL